MSKTKAGITEVTEPFEIFVGNGTSQKIMFGFLDKGLSNIKEGNQVEEMDYTGGKVCFPTYFQAWGRRVIDGVVPNGQASVEVNDPKYRGVIEFLPNGHEGGTTLFCRWKEGQDSLDYDYQRIRLNLEPVEKQDDNLYFELERGRHKIDPRFGKSYALAIKINPLNEDSKCKTSMYGSITLYKEVKPYEVKEKTISEIDESWDAKAIVKNASNSIDELKVIHGIFSKNGEIKYDEADESSLYSALLLYAHEKPSEVLKLVNDYKLMVNNTIEILKAHNQFDTTTNGVLKIGGVKKETVLTDIPNTHKGEDMVQYIYDNCLSPKVYEAIIKLHLLSKTLNN